jgi:hypothetical protein
MMRVMEASVPPVDREQIAARFDRYARLSAIGVLPIGLIAAIDLVTGSLIANRRMDIALLAAAGMGFCSAISTRRLARRFRRNDFPQRPTPSAWLRSLASLGLSIALTGGIGYLLGGWLVSVVLTAVTFVLVASSVAVGLRRRRRRLRAARGAGSSS